MSLARVYLGDPAGLFGMQKLPAILQGNGMTAGLSRATVVHSLASGGSTVTRRNRVKAAYQLSWQIRQAADVDLLQSFYAGRQGVGPFCLVDPTWINMFDENTASMGAVLGALPEWAVNSPQTLAKDATHTPPTGILSGVAAWAGAGSASVLYRGAYGSTDGATLPPVLAGVPHTWGVWARTASSTCSVTPKLAYGIGGSAPGGFGSSGAAVTLTTTWQLISVSVAASFSWPAGSQYAVPELVCNTGSAPNILLAGAQFAYDTAVPAAFATGIGVPRVSISADPSAAVLRPGLRDYVMQLASV